MGLDNASALCTIINMCAKLGVCEFRHGTTHVIFGVANPRPTRLRAAQTRAVAQEAEEQTAEEYLRDDLEHLKLTDPLAYEHQLASIEGDLEGEAT